MAVRACFTNKAINDFEAIFLVRFLPAFEAQFHSHLHVVAKEADRMSQLDAEIVRVDDRAELDFLHLSLLTALGFLLFLGLLVTKLSIIHDAADGWDCRGCDLDKIQSFGIGQFQCVAQWHNPELLLLVIDDTDFASANLSVSTM